MKLEKIGSFIWHGGLALLATVFFTYWWYFGKEDALVHANQFFVIIAFGAVSLTAAVAVCGGAFYAMGMFVQDTRNHLENKPFKWCFLKPLALSLAGPCVSYVLGVSLILFTTEMFPDYIENVAGVFEWSIGATVDMYMVAYPASVLVAALLLARGKFFSTDGSKK